MTCGACVRDCAPGQSFCGRRDATGRSRGGSTWAVVRTDRLFDKPLLHFGPDRPLLNLGTWGCNLRCLGCQNARLSWATDGVGLDERSLAPSEVVALARECACAGVAYTYNEPAVVLDAVLETATAVREAGLFNVLVTNSTLTVPAAARAGRRIEAVAADVKSLRDSFYDEWCGTRGIPSMTSRVLACVKTLRDAGSHVEVRTNVIPGANDDDDGLREIARWVRDELGPSTPWHLTRFFPAHRFAHAGATPSSTLFRAQHLGLEVGLRHVYVYLSKGCDCARDEASGDCCSSASRRHDLPGRM